MIVFGYCKEFKFVLSKKKGHLFYEDNYNKLLGVNPLDLSAARADSLQIIGFQPVKKLIGINPMSLSSPWDDYIDIIALNPVKKYQGLTQWALVPLDPTLL